MSLSEHPQQRNGMHNASHLTFSLATSDPVPLTRTTMGCFISFVRTASMMPSATTLAEEKRTW